MAPTAQTGQARIFATEQSRHRLFEAAAEKHSSANIFLLPAIQIAMAITARAGQVLGDLGVAVVCAFGKPA